MQLTDWLDGYMARRLNHTSRLGSYLDPLADKMFIAAVVGTLGWQQLLPTWLALLVVGRDVALVGGMCWYRARMFGWRWPGAATFFDVDAVVPRQHGTDSATHAANVSSTEPETASPTEPGMTSSSTVSSSAASVQHKGDARYMGSGQEPGSIATSSVSSSNSQAELPHGSLPTMQPLMISKVNTALIFALVTACMSHQWQGVPGQEVLDMMETAIAATTIISGGVYAQQFLAGKLLPSISRQRT